MGKSASFQRVYAHERTSAPKEVVTFTGTVGRETDKAVLFTIQDERYPEVSGKDYWFPLSQVVSIHHGSVVDDRLGSIVVSRWVANAKGLIP